MLEKRETKDRRLRRVGEERIRVLENALERLDMIRTEFEKALNMRSLTRSVIRDLVVKMKEPCKVRNDANIKYVVKESGCSKSGSDTYRKVAVLQVNVAELPSGRDEPAKISTHSLGVKKIVKVWDYLYIKSDELIHVRNEARQLANRMNILGC